MEQHKTGIQEVIETAGSQAKVAEALGVTQQAVSRWLKRGWVSSRRLIELETLYGIPRAKLIDPKIADLVASPGDGL